MAAPGIVSVANQALMRRRKKLSGGGKANFLPVRAAMWLKSLQPQVKSLVFLCSSIIKMSTSGISETVETTRYIGTRSYPSDDVTVNIRTRVVSDQPIYRSFIAPRNLIISRTSYGGPSSGGSRGMSVEKSYGYSRASIPANAYSVITTAGVADVKNSREREKKDMQASKIANFKITLEKRPALMDIAYNDVLLLFFNELVQ